MFTLPANLQAEKGSLRLLQPVLTSPPKLRVVLVVHVPRRENVDTAEAINQLTTE